MRERNIGLFCLTYVSMIFSLHQFTNKLKQNKGLLMNNPAIYLFCLSFSYGMIGNIFVRAESFVIFFLLTNKTKTKQIFLVLFINK